MCFFSSLRFFLFFFLVVNQVIAMHLIVFISRNFAKFIVFNFDGQWMASIAKKMSRRISSQLWTCLSNPKKRKVKAKKDKSAPCSQAVTLGRFYASRYTI